MASIKYRDKKRLPARQGSPPSTPTWASSRAAATTRSLAYVCYLAKAGSRGGLGGRRKVRSDDKKPNKHEDILRVKQATTNEDLCRGLPKGLGDFIRRIRALKFYERPPYDELYGMLNRAYNEALK